MSTPQPAPELTTRDVLQQINRRLSLIETDVRENNTKIEAKIDGLETKTETKIDGLETKTETKIDDLETKIEGKIEVEIRELRREFNGKFNLVIGLVLTTWLSMMGTLLFKL